jgi:hypothetical protein
MPNRFLQLASLIICAGLLSACALESGSEALRAPGISIASLEVDGPLEVRAYTSLPDVPEFGAATVYYPPAIEGRMGAIAIAPGFTDGTSIGGDRGWPHTATRYWCLTQMNLETIPGCAPTR